MPITETVTLDKAKVLIERAIEERGADYVYETPEGKDCACFHADDEGNWKPGCIVGLALSYVGLTKEDVVRSNTGTAPGYMASREGLPIDLHAAEFLGDVQSQQDESVTWGESYAHALDELKAA